MSKQEPIRVLLVDDHAMVRDGLKVFLSLYSDIEVVGEAQSGVEAVTVCAQIKPDVILMDMVMAGMDGPQTTRAIRAQDAHVQVIALTSFQEQDLVQRAVQAGAIGYLLKDVHSDKLAQAIRDAANGRFTIDPAAAQALMQATRHQSELGHDLTRREHEVLPLLVKGKTNREIALDLSISQATVRLHVSNILAKLNAANRTEAASIALNHGLI